MNKYKILVVEDDPSIRELLKQILTSENYDVDTVASGIEGLEAVKNNQYSLALLDALLPGMDGFELCREVRKDHANDKLPIIFVTAMVTEEDALRAFESGADGFIRKPFKTRELKAQVAASILRRHAITDAVVHDAADWIRGGINHSFNQPMTTALGCISLLAGIVKKATDDPALLEMAREATIDCRSSLAKMEKMLQFLGKIQSLTPAQYDTFTQVMDIPVPVTNFPQEVNEIFA